MVEVAETRSTLPWSQAGANLFIKNQGNVAIEVCFEPSQSNETENPNDTENATAQTVGPPWRRGSGRVYWLCDGASNELTNNTGDTNGSGVIAVNADPFAFLSTFGEPIDLLYLNGWKTGTPGYQERHLQAYLAARCNFHDRTVLLIGDTDRDHGGKAALVLPQALEDGFEVLPWGKLTLMGRVHPNAVRDCVPRVGPTVPGEASLDDAIGMHKQGLLWEAEHIYRAILKQWPQHVTATHLLGVVRQQRGDYEAALHWIGKAIALDPGKAAFFNNFGAALQGSGRYVEAMACFHRALQLLPEYADAISNLGLAQGSLGQDELARASYLRALEIHPQHPDSVKRLGELLQKQGKSEQAIELYSKAIAATPTSELCFQLGNLLSQAGRTDRAIEQYQKAIDLNPTSAEAWFNHGVACQDQRMVEESRKCFDRAVELRPERPFWRLRRSAIGPLMFRSNAEIDAYRDDLSQTLDAWLAAPPQNAPDAANSAAGRFTGIARYFPFAWRSKYLLVFAKPDETPSGFLPDIDRDSGWR